ncbi:MAG: nucleoside phosphorylase [Flavobacteriales bacterium]
MHAPLRPATTPIPPSELILRADGSLYHLGITPDQLAQKIIIVGDPERVPLISALFNTVEHRIHNREFVIHTGFFDEKRISIVSTGIGVDNIDIVLNELDAAVNIDLGTRLPKAEHTTLEIVRIGTSGTLHAHIPVGSFVASAMAFALDGVPYSYSPVFSDEEKNLMHELRGQFPHLAGHSGLYATTADPSLLQRIAHDSIQGITATANGFYGPQGRSLRLLSNMEQNIDAYASFQHMGLHITNFEMECSGIYALAAMLGHRATTVCAILANRATKEFHNNPSASVQSLIQQVLARF